MSGGPTSTLLRLRRRWSQESSGDSRPQRPSKSHAMLRSKSMGGSLCWSKWVTTDLQPWMMIHNCEEPIWCALRFDSLEVAPKMWSSDARQQGNGHMPFETSSGDRTTEWCKASQPPGRGTEALTLLIATFLARLGCCKALGLARRSLPFHFRREGKQNPVETPKEWKTMTERFLGPEWKEILMQASWQALVWTLREIFFSLGTLYDRARWDRPPNLIQPTECVKSSIMGQVAKDHFPISHGSLKIPNSKGCLANLRPFFFNCQVLKWTLHQQGV